MNGFYEQYKRAMRFKTHLKSYDNEQTSSLANEKKIFRMEEKFNNVKENM